MNLLLPLLFLAFSTIFGALLAKPLILRWKSLPLMVATSWFTGQYVSAFCIYYLCITLASTGFSHVLFKAGVCFPIFALLVTTLFFRNYAVRTLRDIFERVRTGATKADMVACVAGFLFAFYFFLSQLRTDNGMIKIALVYWDFPVHAPIIQGFVLGDNFPAQNNSLSGIPLTYHFFFDFLISIYAALGLDLVAGLNTVTTIALGFLFASIFGFASEFFGSHKTGLLAMVLTATSGSLRFVYDTMTIYTLSFTEWLSLISGHPYYVADLPDNTAGYNGNMFNIFYFLAERQMIFATIFLVIMMAVLYHRRSFSILGLLVVGGAAGAFMQWHLFVTLSVLMMIGASTLCGPGRRSSVILFVAMLSVVSLQAFQMRLFTQSDIFFPDIHDYPRFNPLFPTSDPTNPETGYPLTTLNFIWYYLFGYGLKFVLIPWGFVRLWRLNRELAAVFLSLAIPTFVAINTIQLSPLSIYDNHKWLRPLNVTLDILVAWVIATGLRTWPTRRRRTLGVCALLVCTAGGAIELVPYLLPVRGTAREVGYSPRHTPLTDLLEVSTPRQSNFLTGGTWEVHLAGRRTFFSHPHDEPGATGMTASFRINEAGRHVVRAQVYNAPTRTRLCEVAQAHDIDYVEQSSMSPSILAYTPSAQWPFISAANRFGQIISFLDINALCAKTEVQDQKPLAAPVAIAPLRDEDRHRGIPLSALTPTSVDASFGPFHGNRAFLDHPIKLAGKTYGSGLGLHAPIKLKYAVPARISHIRGIVGLDDDVADCAGHTIVFRILDEQGTLLFDSGLIVSAREPKPFMVDVTKTKEVTLAVSDSGDGLECDHVGLGDIFFMEGATESPKSTEGPLPGQLK